MVPDGVSVFNPAFDVTPYHFITAIITDHATSETVMGFVKLSGCLGTGETHLQLRSGFCSGCGDTGGSWILFETFSYYSFMKSCAPRSELHWDRDLFYVAPYDLSN